MTELQVKLKILKSLDTKELIEHIHDYENKLEGALREEASWQNLNYEYLASGTNDCSAVKKILAELYAQVPEANLEGKKMTVDDKKDWLTRQRTENQELVAALNLQKNAAFQIDNNRIAAEMAKKRLEGAKAVLGLKTQQLAFLASD